MCITFTKGENNSGKTLATYYYITRIVMTMTEINYYEGNIYQLLYTLNNKLINLRFNAKDCHLAT